MGYGGSPAFHGDVVIWAMVMVILEVWKANQDGDMGSVA